MNPGNPAENRTASILEDFGYIVASRRHQAGPGDLLAYSKPRPNPVAVLAMGPELFPPRGLLIEVKKTRDYPWRGTWGPERRAEMIEAGCVWAVTPLLAWWPWSCKPSKRDPDPQPIWLPVEDWPA